MALPSSTLQRPGPASGRPHVRVYVSSSSMAALACPTVVHSCLHQTPARFPFPALLGTEPLGSTAEHSPSLRGASVCKGVTSHTSGIRPSGDLSKYLPILENQWPHPVPGFVYTFLPIKFQSIQKKLKPSSNWVSIPTSVFTLPLKTDLGAGEVASWVKVLLLLQRTGVAFSPSLSGLELAWGTCTHMHTLIWGLCQPSSPPPLQPRGVLCPDGANLIAWLHRQCCFRTAIPEHIPSTLERQAASKNDWDVILSVFLREAGKGFSLNVLSG